MHTDTNGDIVMSWNEIADLTHQKQIALFNFCICEDSEPIYEDCPIEATRDAESF